MYSFENIKILVVDDEELLREILVETFSMHGAAVDSAKGGNEALQKLQEKEYDILISDVRMPDGDGLTLVSKLKSLNKPNIKVFICSAYNDMTEKKMQDLNILKVFNKPFDLEDLIKEVFDFFNPISSSSH